MQSLRPRSSSAITGETDAGRSVQAWPAATDAASMTHISPEPSACAPGLRRGISGSKARIREHLLAVVLDCRRERLAQRLGLLRAMGPRQALAVVDVRRAEPAHHLVDDRCAYGAQVLSERRLTGVPPQHHLEARKVGDVRV